jgi:hypothetical protein
VDDVVPRCCARRATRCDHGRDLVRAADRAVDVLAGAAEIAATFVAGSAAERTFGGAALVFDVSFKSTAERPMVLAICDPTGSDAARIRLDL